MNEPGIRLQDPPVGPRKAPGVPHIFEAVRDTGVSDGFWNYYEVDSQNPAVNPQNRLLRFVTDIHSFLRPTGRVLSVGCGYGLNEIILSFLSPDLEIIGVDILDDKQSDTKIRSMRDIAKRLQANRVVPILTDGGRLPFRDGSFDCVLAIDSLSHADYQRGNQDLPQSQALLLREMARVVRPGGRLGIVENSAISPRNVMRKGRTSCHPVNPFFLRSILESLGCEVRIRPHYDLTGHGELRTRLVGAILKRSDSFGLLFAPWFMLLALKET